MSSNTSKTILLLAANPKGTTLVRLDEEVREIDEGLLRARQREQFKLVQRGAVRPRDVQRAMLDEKPQIVHFSGHGAGEEGLVFENEVGQPKLVPGEALADLFRIFAQRGVECVVLNGCYSQVQAEAVVQHILRAENPSPLRGASTECINGTCQTNKCIGNRHMCRVKSFN